MLLYVASLAKLLALARLLFIALLQYVFCFSSDKRSPSLQIQHWYTYITEITLNNEILLMAQLPFVLFYL